MQNNRLTPNGNSGSRPSGRTVQQPVSPRPATPQAAVGRTVPQSTPAGRQPAPAQQPVQQPTQQSVPPKAPTQSYEQETPNAQQFTGGNQFPEPPRMGGIPPNMGFEDDYEKDSDSNKKSKKLKTILLGALGLVALVAIIFLVVKMVGGNDSKVETGVLGNTTTEVGTTNITAENSDKFDGNPIPVKWPSDVTPTRMEIQLDPNTGSPILMLIGDKSGLGTVIRSYEKGGSLTGYWVIVPDDDSATSNNTNQAETKTTEENKKVEETQPAEQTEGNSEGSNQ